MRPILTYFEVKEPLLCLFWPIGRVGRPISHTGRLFSGIWGPIQKAFRAHAAGRGLLGLQDGFKVLYLYLSREAKG